MRVFRVYFNRHREAPQVWSVDEGTQGSEVNVVDFFIEEGCTARGRYTGAPSNDDNPSAYMEVRADGYRILGGVAVFYVNRVAADGRP